MQDLGIALEKEVLKVCTTREEALRIEKMLINSLRPNPLCMNNKHTKNWITPAIKPPPAPRGLTWPPQYHDTEFWKRRHGIKVYLETYWVPFIERNMVDMQFMRTYYPSAMMTMYRFASRNGTRPVKEFPAHLRVQARSNELQLYLKKKLAQATYPADLLPQPRSSGSMISRVKLDAEPVAANGFGGHKRRARTRERIEHQTAGR
jgi:hypothetical protein